jgi:prolyl-tRNA editing enzyme YbaK/EbsC (Cys-tRNA(Pro) deacylase)
MMTNEPKPLSRSAQSVQDVLTQKGLPLEVVELASSTRTANDAAESIGCEVAQIIKTLLFQVETTHEPILVLVSGINRVNEKLLERLINDKIVKSDAEFTRLTTGFAIGGVPPVGHKQKINNIFIDEDLLKYEKLWAAAGTPNAVFSIHSKSLENLTGGKLVKIK